MLQVLGGGKRAGHVYDMSAAVAEDLQVPFIAGFRSARGAHSTRHHMMTSKVVFCMLEALREHVAI